MIKKSLLLAIRGIAGVILVLIGLFALVTPFTPGSWLAIIGLELLGLGFIWKWLKPYVLHYLPLKKDKPTQQEPPSA